MKYLFNGKIYEIFKFKNSDLTLNARIKYKPTYFLTRGLSKRHFAIYSSPYHALFWTAVAFVSHSLTHNSIMPLYSIINVIVVSFILLTYPYGIYRARAAAAAEVAHRQQ